LLLLGCCQTLFSIVCYHIKICAKKDNAYLVKQFQYVKREGEQAGNERNRDILEAMSGNPDGMVKINGNSAS